MASAVVARPLPTVLLPADIRSRRSRVVSFSSTSESTPSSNPHSGESWFQVSASRTSHSSASSYPPLPKGARPASPKPTRIIDLDSHSHAPTLDHASPPLKRSGTFPSWKLEWRGISKVVKWAVLGDKPDDRLKPRRPNSSANKNLRHGNYTKNRRGPASQQLDKALPERGFSPYICASPTSPLSPTTSTTCVDIVHGPQCSVSELDHGYSTMYPMSEVHFHSQGLPSISDESLRRRRIVQTSRHGTHVRESHSTSVRRAALELGHEHPYEPSFNMQDTFSNVDRSTTSLGASHHWSRPPRIAHSDIGHSGGVGHMPASAFPSTPSLSYGHDHAYVKPGTKVRAFKNFRSLQSAIVLPVSTPSTGTPTDLHRRPRKLRKSLRAIPKPEGRASRLHLSYSPSSMQQDHSGVVPSKQPSTIILSAPPVPPKSQPRPPRKLKKKPSPALPPFPRTSSRDTSGDPPPPPPKSTIILQSKRESAPPFVSNYYNTGASSESPPALTDSSGSTSPDDELHSVRDSSATYENFNEAVTVTEEGNTNPPVKPPSLLRTESNRRWTVAVPNVPDGLLFEELERLRRTGLRAGDVHGVHNVSQTGCVVATAAETREATHASADRDPYKRSEIKQLERTKTTNAVMIQEVNTEDKMEWLNVRQVISCCRELVRTERSYQERLQELADGDVSDAVPALLLQYLPALIGASKVLSARFNEDMSASGVSSAFLNVSSTLERALVPWSGVVGEFFRGNSSSMNAAKRKRETAIPGFITERETHTEFGAVKVRCMSMSMHAHDRAYVARSSSTRLFSSEGISASSSSHWLFRPAFTQGFLESSNDKDAVSGPRKSLSRREARIKEEKERRRKPPFRDLAILPTQRVTRYVLLYKELLKHTPFTSPTRGLVEKAVETAVRLAEKCDRAQDNSTFLLHG